MRKQNGFILLTTFLILTLMALMTLSQQQFLLMDYKLLNEMKDKQQAFWALEDLANHLISSSEISSYPCLFKELDPMESLDLLKNRKGCPIKYENRLYYFIVEEAGLFPCIQTITNNQTYSTKHFILSIRAADNKSSFLEVRIARAVTLETCKSIPRKIHPGLLSWHYIQN